MKQLIEENMELNEYQNLATKTAIYPGQNSFVGLNYTVLGLCGESGEVAEKVKKIIRDHNLIINEERRNALIKELGDLMWYISNTAKELNMTLEEICQSNLEKLSDRKERNVLKGSGDDR